MGFASSWLQSGTLFPRLIQEAPDDKTGIIVVVPSYDEPGITALLDSFCDCSQPHCKVEVIVVVNAPVGADGTALINNKLTISNIESWRRGKNPFFRLFVIDTGHSAIKGWGVGMARKTGMDEALRRFDMTGMEEGVISNTDADCRVRSDYFRSLEKDLLLKKGAKGCSVFFEHPIEGEEYPAEVYHSVCQYELHLRYYCQSLRHAGFPNSFQTVGSSLAVKAFAYMKAGGMNRRQAGEDFYFIQKLVAGGGFINVNSTTVFPSPRVSHRVPFGTGAAIGKMVVYGENDFLTYHPKSFSDLGKFFEICGRTGVEAEKQLHSHYLMLPMPVRAFIPEKEWTDKIMEIKDNTSSEAAFLKRFYDWFNMFRIVKFLNFTHQDIYSKISVFEASLEFVRGAYSVEFNGNERELLWFLREKERKF